MQAPLRWSSMKFGIDRLLDDRGLRRPLAGKRVALLAHPASVTRELVHSLDALAALSDIKLSAAFGPQHGLRGDKQDNMVESPDFTDPVHGIPVFSLYGAVRRPTAAMMESFDVLLVDLQDLGCRGYTFIPSLLSRQRDARGHDPLRGARHHAASRGVRRAGHRCAAAAPADGEACAAMARGLPPARVLVRADLSQACRAAVRGLADPRRRSTLS